MPSEKTPSLINKDILVKNDKFFIRTEFRELPLQEILNKSPRVFLGVTSEAENILKSLEIETVFDLATSGAFNDATKLLEVSTDFKSVLYQHGVPPLDLIREDEVAGTNITELQFLPISVLQRIPKLKAENIRTVLDVSTIRDFALYPPYRAAVNILNAAYFPENDIGNDPESPADLLPKNGEYPNERVQYSTVVLDEIPMDDGTDIIDVVSHSFKPINIKELARFDAGFKKVAFGALLTFNQSWYSQGVALGQLLHSTTLAPGESTRLAVIDWSRKSRAGETEVIEETEDLSNEQVHNRAISEVTQAVARESQEGFSSTNTRSTSSQRGTSSAMETGSFMGGLFGGPSGSMAESESSAESSSQAESYSSSYGNRELGSSMMQNVNDQTHQQAHSNRTRRASVVKEVSQSEHEQVSTRVIANYNHMHALTIQYYEVLQIFRTEVSIAKADRVIFIPFQLINFTDNNIIHRFRKVLATAALTYDILQSLINLDTIEISLEENTHFTDLGATLRNYAISALTTGTSIEAMDNNATLVNGLKTKTNIKNQIKVSKGFKTVSVINEMKDQLWEREQISRLTSLLNLSVLHTSSSSLFLPNDVLIEDATVDAEGTQVNTIFKDSKNKVIENPSADSPIQMNNVGRIGLSGSNPKKDITAEVVLTLNRNGVRFPIKLPSVLITKNTKKETKLVQIKVYGADVNLKNHLMDNQMYYSQKVFRSLSISDIAMLLSGFSVKVNMDGKSKTVPVSQVIEPKAIRFIGNYLAFKMNSNPVSDLEWAKWLNEHGIILGSKKVDIVPLASGGTFAEAILGRSNCAEKLDITRFWNWQDSPIPLQPTEIAAIQTGSRAISEDVKPGQLSNPVLNITTPTNLPDPVGTAAILAAIQNGNMFRDMSGLKETINLAKTALESTAAGAATAGQQAGTNMNNLLKANTERQRIGAELISSLASSFTGGLSGGGGISGGSSNSEEGAKINYFDKTKEQNSNTPYSGTGENVITPISNGITNSGGTVSKNLNNNGYSANPAALAATWGDTKSKSGFVEHVFDNIDKKFFGESESSTFSNIIKWPYLDGKEVINRINELTINPYLIRQSGYGFCSIACFLYHILSIEARKKLFFDFANSLYLKGRGSIGAFNVEPTEDLRNTDYSELKKKYGETIPPMADWMMMSSIRDQLNWVIDYEGTPEENPSTSLKELSELYDKTCFYYDSDYKIFNEGDSLEKRNAIKAIEKTDKKQIALCINAVLLEPDNIGSHIISLESPIEIDEPNNKIKFKYWTWGQSINDYEGFLGEFIKYYRGDVTATLY